MFLFKGSELTDNDYLGKIIRDLNSHEELKIFSLYPEEKQITIRYNKLNEQEVQITTITNSTFIFNLVSDVEKIIFRFGERRYDIKNKEELDNWYKRIKIFDSK
ncbi:hypothetical protein GLW05_04925 [Pontibacillus yanchengensis]|uniref:Uncharacterized protein n=2 Tax=Pontibacillus yanchengensis TaxID=462910 RepID=A0A6I4ZX77_9BACI|nr:hypothetical protein [Pontibacillus yanchengensis]